MSLSAQVAELDVALMAVLALPSGGGRAEGLDRFRGSNDGGDGCSGSSGEGKSA